MITSFYQSAKNKNIGGKIMSNPYCIKETYIVKENSEENKKFRKKIFDRLNIILGDSDTKSFKVIFNGLDCTEDWRKIRNEAENMASFELYCSFEYYGYDEWNKNCQGDDRESLNIAQKKEYENVFGICNYLDNASDEFLENNQYVMEYETLNKEHEFTVFSYNFKDSGIHGEVIYKEISPSELKGSWQIITPFPNLPKSFFKDEKELNEFMEKVKENNTCIEYRINNLCINKEKGIYAESATPELGSDFEDGEKIEESANKVIALFKEFGIEEDEFFDIYLYNPEKLAYLRILYDDEEEKFIYEYAAA